MIADSPLAEMHPSLGYRKRKFEPRMREPVAIVVHTTGGGIARRLKEPQFAKWRANVGFPRDTFECAIRVYQSVSEACGGYAVGQERGQIAQLVPDGECAWHVGGKLGAIYRHPRARWMTPNERWWGERFPGLESPRQLADGELWQKYGHSTSLRVMWNQFLGGGSVNANTIGIEVACPLEQPAGEWSDAAWENLAELIADIGNRYSIPIDRHHVMSHAEAHPIARSANGKPWDTNEHQFTWRRFAEVAGI